MNSDSPKQMAGDNKSLGQFELTGIPPAPRGMPQIEVTFDLDANGILHVSAKDKATGKEQSIKIESSSGLSREEIDRMVGDAEAHKDEDRQKRERVEVRNSAEQLAHMTEKQLEEHKDKLSAEIGAEVAQALADLKETLKGENIDAIRTDAEKLEKAWHQAAQEMYQQAAAEEAASEGSGEAQGPGSETHGETEEAVEADYEVVDEEEEKEKEKE